jgi:hypothetical protein
MPSQFNNDSITIAGKEVAVRVGFIPERDLRFYPENPRIYSIICEGDSEPSQEEILKKLCNMEHVKELVQSIKVNGGLRDPVIVRDHMVLEGNSRLAAYRILSSRDPAKWGKIKCKILPDNVEDDVAFAILADHISGKKDWKPYEQAGYLYRRHQFHGIPLEQIALDMALNLSKIKNLIMVYSFMLKHNERDPEKWSYYEEYLKSRKLRKVRTATPDLDELVVTKIQTGEIPMAVDVRDKLTVILTSKRKSVFDKFVSGERGFIESFRIAERGGDTDNHYKRLNKFRMWLAKDDVQKGFLKHDKAVVEKCRFELSKIHGTIERLLKKFPDH